MKKILLLLIPLLLLFWVSYATTYTYNYTPQYFSGLGLASSTTVLWFSVQSTNWWTLTINEVELVTGSSINNPRLRVYTKHRNSYDDFTLDWTYYVDAQMYTWIVGGIFYIDFWTHGNCGWVFSCAFILDNGGAAWTGMKQTFFITPWETANSWMVFYWFNSVGPTTSSAPINFVGVSNVSIAKWFYRITYTTDYNNPLSKTIRYNWTSTGFVGNNIYLNGNFSSYSWSGVDLVFNYVTNYFRALFRTH